MWMFQTDVNDPTLVQFILVLALLRLVDLVFVSIIVKMTKTAMMMGSAVVMVVVILANCPYLPMQQQVM